MEELNERNEIIDVENGGESTASVLTEKTTAKKKSSKNSGAEKKTAAKSTTAKKSASKKSSAANVAEKTKATGKKSTAKKRTETKKQVDKEDVKELATTVEEEPQIDIAEETANLQDVESQPTEEKKQTKKGKGRPKKAKPAEEEPKAEQQTEQDENMPEENIETIDDVDSENDQKETEAEEPDDATIAKTENAENLSEKDKKPKVKKPLPKWVLLSGVIASAAAFIAIIVGIIVWWVSVNVPMAAPILSVKMVDDKTYVFADYNENAVSYEFSIKEKGAADEIIVPAKGNMIELSLYLNRPMEFKIKAKALGNVAGANSKWSEEFSYTYYLQLSQPVISAIKNADGTTSISWAPVKYAEKYRVFYGFNGDSALGFDVTPSTANPNQNLTVNLSQRTEFVAGKYNIYVVAYPGVESEYLAESKISNTLEYVKTEQLANATISYDSSAKKYTIGYKKSLIEFVRQFKIVVNGVDVYVDAAEVALNGRVEGNKYFYEFDLSPIYSQEPTIVEITAIAGNQYYLDSQVQTVNI